MNYTVSPSQLPFQRPGFSHGSDYVRGYKGIQETHHLQEKPKPYEVAYNDGCHPAWGPCHLSLKLKTTFLPYGYTPELWFSLQILPVRLYLALLSQVCAHLPLTWFLTLPSLCRSMLWLVRLIVSPFQGHPGMVPSDPSSLHILQLRTTPIPPWSRPVCETPWDCITRASLKSGYQTGISWLNLTDICKQLECMKCYQPKWWMQLRA